MEWLHDALFLARLQFAVTTMLHIIWPLLTIGLSLFLVLVETLYLITGDLTYYRHARFWTRLFLLNFGVGVVTGLPLEFEFGTNWAGFASASGDFFGSVLGFEGAMAFMLEAGFLGIMVFGWNRVPAGMHLFATSMVAFAASLSAFWIMSANAWMQTPAGGEMVDGRFQVHSFIEAIFNPNMPVAVAHMWFACLETSAFVIGGISAWYLLHRRQVQFFLTSFRLAVAAAAATAVVQILVGHQSGLLLFHQQPAKAAAIEAHWKTNPPGEGAAWSVLAWPDAEREANAWSLDIPQALSWLATGSAEGQVTGLRDFPPQDRPPALPLLYYSFRLMVAIGLLLAALALWTLWQWRCGELREGRVGAHPWLWRAWVAAIPLPYLAVEAGWIVREVGRQPWVIYGLVRTRDAVSDLPAAAVLTSLSAYTLIYLVLILAFLLFSRRMILKGPDLDIEPRPSEAALGPLTSCDDREGRRSEGGAH
jgi:cytochrome d ubiquinol oxidase subunit I